MQKWMGTGGRRGESEPCLTGRVRRALTGLIAAGCLLAIAPVAHATFHEISIREVYPGSAAQPQASYLELQMYSEGQHLVGGHAVTLYDSTGGLIGTFTFGSNLPGPSVSQQAILVGDSGVQAAFGVTPDLIDPAFDVPASGGAACWAGSLDCVAWGNFTGSTPSASGEPVDGAGIPDGKAIRRSISQGFCSNLLDSNDDTNDSFLDFADVAPAPVGYGTEPSPPPCAPTPPLPTAAIDSKPPAATSSTSAGFTFHSNPAGAEFECKLDGGAFADCDSGTISYAGPLAEASHTFRVRAVNANGAGAPASYTWKVDLTAPVASITSHPDDLSSGASASFRYSSNEGGLKFECRLRPIEAAFTVCNAQPKVYSALADGAYEFQVRAIDAAGNVQASPTVFSWTVDNTLPDLTPPETSIDTKPLDPSSSSTATFTYSSTEAGSSFECKLDGGGFTGCPAAGVTYTGLAGGSHTFQVRAIDPSGNADPTPAGYSFSVVLASPPVAIASSGSAPAPPPPPAVVAPQTTLGAKPAARTRDRTPSFRFRSSDAGAIFQCRLDGGPFKPCRSPFTTKPLPPGRHTVKIRAVLNGVPDPTPATYAFTVAGGR
jgi:hypothetical protein